MADQNESMRSLEEDGDKKHMKWEEKLTRVGPVSKPMATRKLAKKIYKITKKGRHASVSDDRMISVMTLRVA